MSVLRLSAAVWVLITSIATVAHAADAPTTRPATSPAPLLFLQLSDPQFGMHANNKDFAQETANFEFAIATANRLRPAFVVITGDLVNRGGDAAQIAEFKRIAAKLDPAIHLYVAPGNHDVGNKPTPQTIAAYVEKFGPDHYRFREGDVIGLVLNSSLIHTPDAAAEQYAAQQKWLETELEAAKRDGAGKVIVFQHHPIFLKAADEPDQYFNLPLVRRGPYIESLKRYGVTHVFTGHLHQEKTAKSGDLEVVVTGATGKPLGGTRSGMRVVVVRDGQVYHRWYDFGELPNKIDPTTWPAGELLKPAK
jgi:3',5'-cyclic AMP phosphodiesterase CpdA